MSTEGPKNKKKKKQPSKYGESKEKEVRLRAAQDAIAAKTVKSVAQAARDHNVPKGTLHGRKNGRKSRKEAHADRQALSPELERVLCIWSGFLGYMGLAVTKERMVSKAKAISPPGVHLGKNWWRKFKRRNRDDLKFKKAQGLDPKRAQNFNREYVAKHFKNWEDVCKEFDIPRENIWNMDEKAIQLGGGRRGSNRKFFFGVAQEQLYKIKSDDLKMVTVIECVSAAGVAMEPTFISPSPDVGYWWDIDGVAAYVNVFIPKSTALNTTGKPIILLLDGHQSHVSDAMKQLAFENNIFLFCLPPKTTHKLQPLDALIFAAIQAAWSKLCEERAIENRIITLDTAFEAYMEARKDGMKEATIVKSWEKTGHWPINPNIFTDEDYAPSIAYSTNRLAPEGYPEEVPSSPPAAFTSDLEYDDAGATESDDDASDTGGSDVDDINPSGDDDEDNGNKQNQDSSAEPAGQDEGEAVGIDDEGSVDGAPIDEPGRADHREHEDTCTGTRSPVPSPSLQSQPNSEAPQSRRKTSTAPSSSSHFTLSHTPKSHSYHTRAAYPPLPDAPGLSEQERIAALEARVAYLNAQLNAANAHATIMALQNERQSEEIKRLKAPKKKKVNLFKGEKSGFLTHPAAKQKFREELAAKEKEAAEAAAAEAEKDAKRRADERRRVLLSADENYRFEGTLASYKTARKDRLKDLLSSLELDDSGTNPEMFDRIAAHFGSNPHLKELPRYAALFSTQRGKKRSSHDVTEAVERNTPFESEGDAALVDGNYETPPSPPKRRRTDHQLGENLLGIAIDPPPPPSSSGFAPMHGQAYPSPPALPLLSSEPQFLHPIDNLSGPHTLSFGSVPSTHIYPYPAYMPLHTEAGPSHQHSNFMSHLH